MSGSAPASSDNNVVLDRFKKLAANKNHVIWKAFDSWAQEDPALRRNKFQKVRACMVRNSWYAANVCDNVFSGADVPFEYFGAIANETGFVTGNGEAAMSKLNVYDLLAEIFSQHPDHRNEAGKLLPHLEEYFNYVLPFEFGWRKLVFDPRLFRPLYYQLIKTFELNIEDPASSSDDDGDESPMKGQVLFSCFVISVLAAIWNEHAFVFGSLLPGYRNITDVEVFLLRLLETPFFRYLSAFFIVSFSLILKLRSEGGFVTETPQRPYAPERAEEDRAEFLRRACSFTPPPSDFELSAEYDKLQLFWLNNLRHCLLSQEKRSRKAAKRKGLNLEELGSPRKMTKKAERSPTKKRKSVRKEDVDDAPGPSSPSPSPPPEERPAPKVVTAEDVGLLKPIYVQQMDMVRWFNKEVQRRQREGSTPEDRKNLMEKFHEHFRETQRLADLSMSREPMKLNKDQKAMMSHFRKTWKQADPEPFYLNQEKDETTGKNKPSSSASTSAGPSTSGPSTSAGPSTSSAGPSTSSAGPSSSKKRWKRYY